MIDEGRDVSDLIGIKKYERPEVMSMTKGTRPRGSFPVHLFPKTDEPRIQSHEFILQELETGDILIATEKIDGTSATYAVVRSQRTFLGIKLPLWTYETYVCSRNMWLGRDDATYHGQNVYYQIDDQYGITDKLKQRLSTGDKNALAIQGEIVGPGIQKNPLKLDKLTFYVHNVYDIDLKQHMSPKDMTMYSYHFGLAPVKEADVSPVYIGETKITDPNIVPAELAAKYYVDMASQLPKDIEGLVFRLATPRQSHSTGNRLSFKAVNNTYLLANDS